MTEQETKRSKSCHHDVQSLCEQDVGQARGADGWDQLIDQASAVISSDLFVPDGVVIEGRNKNDINRRGQNLDNFWGIPLKDSLKYDVISIGAIHAEAIASSSVYLVWWAAVVVPQLLSQSSSWTLT